MIKSAVGIDIGGTKIALIIGTIHGKILAQKEIPTQTGRRTQDCIHQLVSSLEELIAFARARKMTLQGIGLCIPGAVDSLSGRIPRSPNLPGWANLPIKPILQKKFRLPVSIANDANAAAVGEFVFGQGRGLSDFIYMTVSTGIGGGIYVHGKLLEGASYVGGEIGHSIVQPTGEQCQCGNKGCLEAYASGTAMASYTRHELSKGRKSLTLKALTSGNYGLIDGKLLGLAAKRKDPLALEAYRRGAFYLGIGVANLLNILNPEKVILGGGVMKSAPPLFWQVMMKTVKANAWPEAFRAVRIVESNLKGSIGSLGALALAFEKKL